MAQRQWLLHPPRPPSHRPPPASHRQTFPPPGAWVSTREVTPTSEKSCPSSVISRPRTVRPAFPRCPLWTTLAWSVGGLSPPSTPHRTPWNTLISPPWVQTRWSRNREKRKSLLGSKTFSTESKTQGAATTLVPTADGRVPIADGRVHLLGFDYLELESYTWTLPRTLIDRSCMHQIMLFYCVRAEREPFLFNLMQLSFFLLSLPICFVHRMYMFVFLKQQFSREIYCYYEVVVL